MEQENVYEKPVRRHREGTARIIVRREIGILFRDACDRIGQPANHKLEQLIFQWNVERRPSEILLLLAGHDARIQDGRAGFQIQQGCTSMVRQFARREGRPYYQVFEAIMLSWLQLSS